MIRGVVNSRYEAVVNLRVRGPVGAGLTVDVVVDTGATSSLTLPPADVVSLGLTYRSTERAMLADGTVLSVDLYDAEVEWDGTWRTVLVTELDTRPLLGTRLLVGHEMYVEFVSDGAVDITALP